MSLTTIKRGLGFDNDGYCNWERAGKVRLFLSRWFGIGNWFGPYEECERCGAQAYDVDFCFERVGFRRNARCADRGSCDYTVRENSIDDTGEEPDRG